MEYLNLIADWQYHKSVIPVSLSVLCQHDDAENRDHLVCPLIPNCSTFDVDWVTEVLSQSLVGQFHPPASIFIIANIDVGGISPSRKLVISTTWMSFFFVSNLMAVSHGISFPCICNFENTPGYLGTIVMCNKFSLFHSSIYWEQRKLSSMVTGQSSAKFIVLAPWFNTPLS